jgi:PAS domain S-box-containing protein
MNQQLMTEKQFNRLLLLLFSVTLLGISLLTWRFFEVSRQHLLEELTRLNGMAEADLAAALASHARYDAALVLSIILLLAVSGGLVWYWWRARFYRREYEASEALRAVRAQAQAEADLLRNLGARVPGVIYQYQFYPDGRSRFPYASEGIRHIYDVAPEDVIEDANIVFDRLHPDDVERVSASIKHSFQTGEVWHDIYRVILPERGERWLEGRAMPQPMADGSVLWHGYISDITERKQMEEALQDSERRLLEAQSLAQLGNWEWNVRTQCLYWSDEIYRIFGATPREFEPSVEAFEAHIHPDDLADFLQQREEMLAAGKTAVIDHRIILPDGAIRYVQERAYVLRDEAGATSKVVGTVQDITERTLMEEALRENEARFRSYVEYAPYGFFIADEQGRYQEVNPAASAISGYSQADLLTMRIADIVPEEAHADAFAHFQRVRYEGYAIGELPFIHQSGEIRYWSVIAVKLAPNRFMGFKQDITDLKRAEEVQTRLSEELEKVFQGSHAAMFLAESVDEQTFRYVRTNSVHQQLTGFSLEDIRHKTPQEMLGEEVGGTIAANYRRCLQEGQSISYEEDLHLPGGHRIWETHLTPVFAPGKRPYIVGSSIDMTEKRQAERSLEEEKTLLKAIIDNIPILITRYDREGNLLYLNKAFEETFGWTTAEAKTINLLEAVYPDPDYRQEALAYMLAAKVDWREFSAQTRSGEVVPSEWANIRLEDGSQMGIGLDIRERRRVEKAVLENQRYLQTILETTVDGFWVADSDLKMREVNDAYCQMSGYRHEEFQYLRISDLDALEEEAESAARARRIIENGHEIFTTKHRRKDGSTFDVEVSATYLEMEGGLFVCFCRDITRRKAAEAALRQSHEELREALLALQEAQAHLLQQERLATLGHLAAGVAHELNNPLTSIILYAQLLRNYRQIDPKVGHDIEQITTQAQRASGIVRGLLDFARQRPLQKERVQVNDTLRSTLNFMAYELRSHQVQVEEALAPDLPQIAADPQQLQQVFVNLLNNAVQALNGRSDNKITITTTIGASIYPFNAQDSEPVVRVIIQDNGPGMPPEMQKRVFDPFFTTKQPGQGTGLGLSVCHGIVREHGGHIWVESEPEQGAAFLVELPLLAPLEDGVRGKETAVVAPSLPAQRVLLVDDEEAIRQVVTRILETQCQVDVASNGEEALALVGQRHYDLIICDLYMPVMGGLEFYGEWQERYPEQTAVIPILFITGDTVNPYVRQSLQKLGVPSLPKPFDIEQLLATTAALLQK